MTTVVAVARDGQVAMAADTCTNVYERPIPGGATKILRGQTGHMQAVPHPDGRAAIGSCTCSRRRSMLLLSADLLHEVVDRCETGWPLEVCGILAGPAGQQEVATRHVPLSNAAPAPEATFVADAVDQLAAYADMDARGEDPVVLYHSHPRGDAVLSATDAAMAATTGTLWLVVPTGRGVPARPRCWRIADGAAVEELIQVIDHEPRPAPSPQRI